MRVSKKLRLGIEVAVAREALRRSSGNISSAVGIACDLLASSRQEALPAVWVAFRSARNATRGLGVAVFVV